MNGMKQMAPGAPLLQSDQAEFHDAVTGVLGAIRNALDTIASQLGVAWTDQNQLTRALGISKNLAWKLSRVMHEQDPMVALPLIPGRDAFEILIEKSGQRGADQGSIGLLRESLDLLEEVTRRHASDRISLELLAAGCATDHDNAAAMNHRKSAFMGNAFTWGIQARVLYKLTIFRESPTCPGMVDMALVTSLLTVRKNRPLRSWVLTRVRTSSDRPEKLPNGKPGPEISPLNRMLGRDQIPLIEQFCSTPVPTVRSERTSDGAVEYRIENWPVGDTGALSVTIGTLIKTTGSIQRDAANDYIASVARLNIPAESMVFDLYVQRGLFGGVPPTLHVVSDLGMPLATGVETHREMQVPAQVVSQGPGLRGAPCPDVPACADLARTVFGWIGSNPDQFDLHRAILRYPPIAASAIMRIPLPDA